MTTEIKAAIAAILTIATVSAFLLFTHHERDIGEKKVEIKDTAALAVAKDKADEGTKENLQAAAAADSEADHDQQVIDNYVRSHPVGAVRLCRNANNSQPVLPATGATVPAASSAGSGTALVQQMPDGNPGPDLGPGLDAIVQAAGRMATLYVDRQRRDAGGVPVK